MPRRRPTAISQLRSPTPFARVSAHCLVVETINGQDMMAWVTQGDISDRTTERLGTSDKGVILFRNLLIEQIDKVERGEDPMGVIRDPARNEPYIPIGRERVALRAFDIQRNLTRAADAEVSSL